MKPQILLLFTLNIFASMGYSLIAPLFPILATKNHLSESLLGWIISIYSLTNFLITPFSPQIIKKIGRLKLFYSTLILEAFSTIIYGIFKYISNSTFLIFISFLVRLVHGVGSGLMSTLLYSLGVSISAPEEITQSLGYLEVAWSVGISIGPVFASLLFHLGGFSLPFYTFGLLFFVPIYFIKFLNIPNDDCYNNNNNNTNNNDKNEDLQFFKFFNMEMFINFLATVVYQIGQTYYFPSLTYHLMNKWNLSIESSSLFFMIGMTAYFIGLQVLNKILENFGLILTILLGQILIIIGSPLVYPLNFLPQSIITIILGLALLGISGAFTCVAVIIQFGKIAKKTNNLLNDSSINDISAAVFNLGINVGDFIGPIFGGFISTKYSFKYSNVYMSVIGFAGSILYFFFYRNDMIFVIKDIFVNGFKITRYEANNIDINERKDVRMSRGRKFTDSSFSESFQVVNKNDFLKNFEKEDL